MSQLFTSMPNFRELVSPNKSEVNNSNNCNAPTSKNGSRIRIRTLEELEQEQSKELVQDPQEDCMLVKLYRSSRPDFLTEEEIHKFKSLGIRCIIDFRSSTEYRKATGSKLLDSLYPVYKVKLPLRSRYKPGEPICYFPLKGHFSKSTCVDSSTESNGFSAGSSDSSEECEEKEQVPTVSAPIGKHMLINFFKMQYIWAVFRRAPWHIKLCSLFYLLIDLVLGTGYRYFVRIFARGVLNKEGLYGQYIDMLEHSQTAICAALKLLCERDNVPAMLNCAHGKDRTGIVSAMVLSCLGKSKHFIATDYARSEEGLEPMADRLYTEIVEKFHMCQTFTTAKYETMMKVLQYIDDTYGSVADYLESLAFSRLDQEKLRANLIDMPYTEVIKGTVLDDVDISYADNVEYVGAD